MAIDEGRLSDFMGRFVTDLSGAVMMASVMIGDELGLYRVMADSEPTTADELAERAGCNRRLILEWLNAQTASGYVEFDGGTYRLPEEQALALAVEDSPVFVAPAPAVAASLFLDKDKTIAAMRGNGAMSWGDHHPCLFTATEKFFRPGYKANLVASWLPALNGVTEKLEAGAKVADVGCGHGASTIILAQAYPDCTFHGYDFHAPSIAAARERAADAGVSDRITFSPASAKEYTDNGFDLICFFDCLHDMGDPVGAARHAYETLADDGTVLLVEPFAGDRLEDNCNPVGRMYYAASTAICTPNSLSQEVGRALGAQAGEAQLRQVFTEAGFTHFRRATETPFNLIFEAKK
jgi:ubiquinone/menaquinone biosynthesis C-methylase UbiE